MHVFFVLFLFYLFIFFFWGGVGFCAVWQAYWPPCRILWLRPLLGGVVLIEYARAGLLVASRWLLGGVLVLLGCRGRRVVLLHCLAM